MTLSQWVGRWPPGCWAWHAWWPGRPLRPLLSWRTSTCRGPLECTAGKSCALHTFTSCADTLAHVRTGLPRQSGSIRIDEPIAHDRYEPAPLLQTPLRPRNLRRHRSGRRHAAQQQQRLHPRLRVALPHVGLHRLLQQLEAVSSSWYSGTTSPIKPRPAVSAAGVLGLGVVQWRRCAAMTGVAAGRSRSRFSSKLEDAGVHEIQRDRVAAEVHGEA